MITQRGGSYSTLRARRLGIDTYREHVVYMHAACEVCRSEGFESQARVQLSSGDRTIPATLNVVTSDLLRPGEAGLAESAWFALDVSDGHALEVRHMPPPVGMSSVRAKVYGRELDAAQYRTIVEDVGAGRFSNVQIAAFLTACATGGMSTAETVSLAHAMIDAGRRLTWPAQVVADKHCIGGLPGNRTTPIVVAIVAACGGVIPKTSSRAITSPAGTADVMEALAPVDLDLATMRRVVEQEGACVAWGGAVSLSPVDDLLIRVERPLDLDSDGQLIASVLSKKAAAGSTHVLIDIPVGPTAKVRSPEHADRLANEMHSVAKALGLTLGVVLTDGSQPVGRGIGPALEARDVLAVLEGRADAPSDLRGRSLELAGHLLELAGLAGTGAGLRVATETLDSGNALRKFERICEAQGGRRTPPIAAHRRSVLADRAGVVVSIDNRRLARVAKLAGAPRALAAGLDLHVHVGFRVGQDEPFFTVHAQSPGELEYALGFLASEPPAISIADAPAARERSQP